MRLEYADLRNLCQHTQTYVRFAPGLNFIVGPNGVGKSNLLNMIFGVISGDFKRNDGNKDANICQLAEADASSYGEVMMHHLGRSIQIHHGLRGSGVWLVDGHSPKMINGSTSVYEHMTRTLGASPKLLDEHVFVAQGDVASFFSALDSERAKLCNRLFGLEVADKVYGTVNKHIAALTIPTVGALKDQLTARVTELQCKQKGLQQTLAQLGEIIPVDYDYEADPEHTLVRTFACICTLQNELMRLQVEHQRLQSSVDEMKPKHEALTEDLVSMTNFLAKEAGKREQARHDVVAWGNYTRVVTRLAELDSGEKNLQDVKNVNPEPFKPDNYVTSREESHQEFWVRYEQLQNMVAVAKQHIKAAETGKPCPHCGTAAPQLQDALTEHRQTLHTHQMEFDLMHTRVQASEAYDNVRYRWQRMAEQWQQKEFGFKQERQRLKEVVQPAKSLAESTTYLQDMLTMERAKDDTSAQLSQLNFSRLAGCLDAHTRNLTAKRVELAGYGNVSKEDADDAQGNLKLRLSALTSRKVTQQEFATVAESLRATQKQLDEVVNLENEAAISVLWQKQVEELKSIVHTAGAPRLSAESNLRILQEDINDLLLRFDAPYRVSATGNLSFTAHFFRGEKAGIRQPASRLSGGEEILLALAFRIAVHGRFAGELGLLCMDEPTSFLDKKNLACVMTGFERLRELCKNTGLQVVIVTHDERLLPLADNVIDLGAMKEVE
jgi:DNA repair exonuclease SbcCD ATPase subunit